MAKKDKEKNKENKENKKAKGGSSSFFSNLNTDSSIEYGYAEKNPKSKWTKWIIGGLIGGVAITGISVPWALSSCTVQLNKPYDDNNVMYSYYDPNLNKTISVTYKEFSERVNKVQAVNSILDKWDDVFYKSVLEKLYNEERDAFLKFKAIYKKLHGQDPTVSNFGADLTSSFNEIETNQRKILENNKKSFQKALNGSDNWLNLWIKELQTNSIYGPQKTEEGSRSLAVLEEKAISYMVTQQIKTASLARFNGTSINSTNWTYEDFQFANKTTTSTEKYTSYRNNEGTEIDITEKDAVDVWKAYLTKDVNVVQPKDIDSSNNKQIAVFETKSYSTEYRNPVANDKLINIIKSNYNYGLVSSVSITGIAPNLTSKSFTISSDVLKSLFTIQNINATNDTVNFVPFSQLSNFTGANTISTTYNSSDKNYIQNQKDDLFVKTFKSDDQTLGSSKYVDSVSLLTKNESSESSDSSSTTTLNMFYLSALASSDNGATAIDTSNTSLFSINKKNPFTTFMKLLLTIANSQDNKLDLSSEQEVQTNWTNLEYGSQIASSRLKMLVKFLSDNLDSTNYTFKGTINASDFNTRLTNYIDALEESDLAFMGKLLNCVLIGDNSKIKTNYKQDISPFNQIGYWTLYELSAPNTNNNQIGTYMYLEETGIRIFSKNFKEPTKEEIQKMVINDLNMTINTSSTSDSSSDSGSTTTSLIYDIQSMFAKLNDDNLIIVELLKDTNNQTLFKNAIKELLEKENNLESGKYEEEANNIYQEFLATADLKYQGTKSDSYLSIISNVSSSLTTIIDKNMYYDFATYVNDNKEELVVFQTQTKYAKDSIAQSKDIIDNLFIQTLENILRVSPKQNVKGGK